MCIKNLDQNINCNTKEITEKLFSFYEEELYKNTAENRELVDKILKIEKPLYKSLNDMQKQQFEELVELKALNEAVTDKNIFVFAFGLATNLILESRQN